MSGLNTTKLTLLLSLLICTFATVAQKAPNTTGKRAEHGLQVFQKMKSPSL